MYEIRSNKETFFFFNYILLWDFISFFAFWLIGGSFKIALFYFIFIFLVYLYGYFSHCRILYFDKNGCKVKCLMFEKQYSWEDIKYVNYFKYAMNSKIKANQRVISANDHGLEFSTKPIKRKKSTNPCDFSFAFNFSYFYVTFPYKPTLRKIDYEISKKRAHVFYFVEDQEKFINSLKEWGVKFGNEEIFLATWDK